MSEKNTQGETDLGRLLKTMSPLLNEGEFVFLTFPGARYGDQAMLAPIASFMESEGLTLVVPKDHADEKALVYQGVFKCITLQVHSSLEAVGLTAAFAEKLTSCAISANVIAGFYHDHILVSVSDADSAMSALRELAG